VTCRREGRPDAFVRMKGRTRVTGRVMGVRFSRGHQTIAKLRLTLLPGIEISPESILLPSPLCALSGLARDRLWVIRISAATDPCRSPRLLLRPGGRRRRPACCGTWGLCRAGGAYRRHICRGVCSKPSANVRHRGGFFRVSSFGLSIVSQCVYAERASSHDFLVTNEDARPAKNHLPIEDGA
jgi:hypothetical protein